MSLASGHLPFYRGDRRLADLEEEPRAIQGARSAPAIDYTKRRRVFRIRLPSGVEILFQALDDQTMMRWVTAINRAAGPPLVTGGPRHQRSLSLPPSARQQGRQRLGSMTRSGATSGGTPLRERVGSLRKIFRRN